MKRVLLAVLIWILLVGGLYEYMHRRNANPVARSSGVSAVAASGIYTLELTPGFVPVPDPFALNLDVDGGKAPALFARLRGREILSLSGDIVAGASLRVENIPGVSGGDNEIVVAASPPIDGASGRHFLQARVLKNGVPIASEIFWAEGSARVDGVLRFAAPAQSSTGAEADHDK